jgi:hypothetical protein
LLALCPVITIGNEDTVASLFHVYDSARISIENILLHAFLSEGERADREDGGSPPSIALVQVPAPRSTRSVDEQFEYSLSDHDRSGTVGISILNEDIQQERPMRLSFRRRD